MRRGSDWAFRTKRERARWEAGPSRPPTASCSRAFCSCWAKTAVSGSCHTTVTSASISRTTPMSSTNPPRKPLDRRDRRSRGGCLRKTAESRSGTSEPRFLNRASAAGERPPEQKRATDQAQRSQQGDQPGVDAGFGPAPCAPRPVPAVPGSGSARPPAPAASRSDRPSRCSRPEWKVRRPSRAASEWWACLRGHRRWRSRRRGRGLGHHWWRSGLRGGGTVTVGGGLLPCSFSCRCCPRSPTQVRRPRSIPGRGRREPRPPLTSDLMPIVTCECSFLDSVSAALSNEEVSALLARAAPGATRSACTPKRS